MYRIGYIDDEPTQYDNFAKKIQRKYPLMQLILLDGCTTKAEFVEAVYEKEIDVLLIDYKMAKRFGFEGTTLINYINDQIRDLECFILTAVDAEQIGDGLVAKRNRFPKTIFDTEADDPEKVKKLDAFMGILYESAAVFERRRNEKVSRYKELLEKKKQGTLGADEQEFLELYKVLASYGMVEKLKEDLLRSDFEQALDQLIKAGEIIISNHAE